MVGGTVPHAGLAGRRQRVERGAQRRRGRSAAPAHWRPGGTGARRIPGSRAADVRRADRAASRHALEHAPRHRPGHAAGMDRRQRSRRPLVGPGPRRLRPSPCGGRESGDHRWSDRQCRDGQAATRRRAGRRAENGWRRRALVRTVSHGRRRRPLFRGQLAPRFRRQLAPRFSRQLARTVSAGSLPRAARSG